MFKLRTIFSVALLLLASGAYAQTKNEFATANMRFDAKEMDANGDSMISRDEMMKYGEKMWTTMANGKTTIPVAVAAQDFATGGLAFNAKAMDPDHDGTISKEEFMTYSGKKFDQMKNADGMMSVNDAAKSFARGNPHQTGESTPKETSSPPR
jgi:Ca2+-binding EF-hand superfamily protein